jgi:NarL family two-component system response regulator LiaR
MGMVMPELDGETATRIIRTNNPEIQIIALTSFREEELVNAALKAGAIGYLMKNITAEELAIAIRNAARGHPTLAPEATLALIHTATAQSVPGDDLTERERDVLLLMTQGLNNQQIAFHLGIGLSTVKYHVSNIISKLEASNRTEAASIAIQHHLVN